MALAQKFSETWCLLVIIVFASYFKHYLTLSLLGLNDHVLSFFSLQQLSPVLRRMVTRLLTRHQRQCLLLVTEQLGVVAHHISTETPAQEGSMVILEDKRTLVRQPREALTAGFSTSGQLTVWAGKVVVRAVLCITGYFQRPWRLPTRCQ